MAPLVSRSASAPRRTCLDRCLALGLMLAATAGLAQGRVVAAGQLTVARAQHTATLLADGRVLVVGGRGVDGLTALASAELFDPRTRRWSRAAPLHFGRAQHTATRLADGRVLVTGGVAPASTGDDARFVALASAEVYEPRRNTWTELAPMADARASHTATLLPDGSVLVVGGAREQRVELASVERFEPQRGRFQPLLPLLIPRAQHAAVGLPDGSVVVLGGRARRAGLHGPVSQVLDAAERFVPATQTWQLLPSMSEARQRPAALAQGDEVLVIGGQTGTSSTNLIEAWALGARAWAHRPGLAMGRSGHTATRLSAGDVLVVGGEAPTAVDTPWVQRWRPDARRWCVAGQLRASRKGHTATLLPAGGVLVVGGTSGGLPEASAELWEAAGGPCEEPPALPAEW